MNTIISAVSESDIETAATLFREYEKWLGLDLCFQGFEAELASLPGKYSPPNGRLFLAYSDNEPSGCIALRPLVVVEGLDQEELRAGEPVHLAGRPHLADDAPEEHLVRLLHRPAGDPLERAPHGRDCGLDRLFVVAHCCGSPIGCGASVGRARL